MNEILKKKKDVPEACSALYTEPSVMSLHDSMKVQPTEAGPWEEYDPSRHRNATNGRTGKETNMLSRRYFANSGAGWVEDDPGHRGMAGVRPGDAAAGGAVIKQQRSLSIAFRTNRMFAAKYTEARQGTTVHENDFRHHGGYNPEAPVPGSAAHWEELE